MTRRIVEQAIADALPRGVRRTLWESSNEHCWKAFQRQLGATREPSLPPAPIRYAAIVMHRLLIDSILATSLLSKGDGRNLPASPLFDADGFRRDIEAAYLRMREAPGESARSFAVE